MEQVLDRYHEPYDPLQPLICMDETSKQLTRHISRPLPMKPGREQRIDYEYERNGTANLFLFTEPLTGWRTVSVTNQRRKSDWAHAIRELLDVHYPHATKVKLVMDNLNTHAIGSLYETFPPEEAHRLASRLAITYTPVHGSWLNIAEIELKALSIECLARRIESVDRLTAEVAAWEADRNNRDATVDWQFTTADARIRLKHLYPKIRL